MPVRVSSRFSSASSAFQDRRPEDPKSWRQKFLLFLYNKETKTICGRTCLNWGKVVLFYFTFLSCLALLFSACLLIYLAIIGTDNVYKSKADLVDIVQPGVGFFPNVAKIQTAAIYYDWNAKDSKHRSYREYVQDIIYNLRMYRKWAERPIFNDCEKQLKKPCAFYVSELGPCSVKGKDAFGYKSNKPCIYFRLNDVIDWEPEYYDMHNLPRNIPPDLKHLMRKENDTRLVWLYCDGLNNHDKEHLGSISYYPSPGFKGYYYPFKVKKEFMPPIVAIKLNELKRGYLVNIKCTAYARNIEQPHRSTLSLIVHIPLNVNQREWP